MSHVRHLKQSRAWSTNEVLIDKTQNNINTPRWSYLLPGWSSPWTNYAIINWHNTIWRTRTYYRHSLPRKVFDPATDTHVSSTQVLTVKFNVMTSVYSKITSRRPELGTCMLLSPPDPASVWLRYKMAADVCANIDPRDVMTSLQYTVARTDVQISLRIWGQN